MFTTQAVKRIEMTYLRKSGDLCGWSWRKISWNYKGEPSGFITAKIATGSDGEDHYMELGYSIRLQDKEEWRPLKYRVKMESTPCRFGGHRWWFHCPANACNRRCSILYQHLSYFVCRKCAGLKYESQEYSGKYAFLKNLFDADEYAMKLKRWYYRGQPTRKHRRYLKMTRGMSQAQQLEAQLAVLRA